MRKQVFGLLCAALLLAACGETVRSAAPTVSPTVSPTATTTATTTATVDCGTSVLTQGDTVVRQGDKWIGPPTEATPQTAYRCFVEAVRSRRPAQLKETRRTVEAAHIRVTYIAGASGRVEVITDKRGFNSATTAVVSRQMCSGPTAGPAGLTFATCATGAAS